MDFDQLHGFGDSREVLSLCESVCAKHLRPAESYLLITRRAQSQGITPPRSCLDRNAS